MSNALPAPAPSPGVTTASQWKNQVKAHPVQVPSGNTCLMRKVGLQVFVSQGMIPNSLMPIVQAAITKGQPPSQKDLEKLPSETLMNDMIDLIDKNWEGALPATFVYDRTGKLTFVRYGIIDREQMTLVIEKALKG